MKKIYFWILSSIGFYWIWIDDTYAVPPPDFIMQVVSQFLSFFTIGIVLLSWLYATGIQLLKWYYQQYKLYVLLIGIPVIIILAGIGAYYMNIYYQDKNSEQIQIPSK